MVLEVMQDQCTWNERFQKKVIWTEEGVKMEDVDKSWSFFS